MSFGYRPLVAVLAIPAVLAACGSSGAGGGTTAGGAAPAGSSTVTSVPAASPTISCPAASTAAHWPKQAPAHMPVPPGLHIVRVQRSPNVVIRFTVPMDFHASVRYLLDAIPKAGFTLGTGDSEAEEADLPFSHGAQHASLKINDGGRCLTNGLLAVGGEA